MLIHIQKKRRRLFAGLLAAGLVGDLIDSRNDLFEGIEELMAEMLPGVSAAAGSSREGSGMPFLRGKRSRKRKKA